MRRPPSGCTSSGSNEPSSATRARQIVTPRPWSSARAPMCGESARTRSTSSTAGRSRSSRRSSARDLLRVGRLPDLLAERRRGVGEHAVEQLDRELGGAFVHGARRRRRARPGTTPARRSGPRRAPSTSRMIVTPVSASPAMSARSTGAAPRQRGRSDGWTFSQSRSSSTSSGTMSPYATATTTSARRDRGPVRGAPARAPECRVAAADSLAGERREPSGPCPAGASGRVSSARDLVPSARRSRTSAPKGAVAATAIGRVNARRGRAAA